MNFSRLDQIHSLEEHNKFELLVIGGGVVGSAILELAASQGINSLLIEKNDFSSGASSRSTKLLHGGIRYLPQMQFGLTRESLKEQKILEQVLGQLYKPLKLLAPVFKDDGFSDLPKILQSNFIAPLVANMIEGGATPVISKSKLHKMGFKIVLYPLSVLFSNTYSTLKLLQELKKSGTTRKLSKQIVNFNQFNDIVELSKYRKLEQKYKK